MNKKQKIIAFIGVWIIVIIGFFPPWKIIIENPHTTREAPVGYYFIFTPPQPPAPEEGKEEEEYFSMTLDLSRMTVHWITALFTLAALLYLAQEKKKSDPEEEDEEKWDDWEELVNN